MSAPGDPADVKPPVVFDASSTRAVSGTVIGAALILATGLPTLLGLLKARDLVAIISWVKGTDGVEFISAAGFVATLAWRVTSSWRRHIRAVIAARAAPNDIAQVKGETP